LGRGPGGYTAAFLAAGMGMKVTLVDSRMVKKLETPVLMGITK